MSFDVFISYSSNDIALANAVKQALQAEGVRCWKAPEDVIPDSNTHYAAQIVEAIERCPVMVLIWSVSSMESLEVSKELSVAMDAKTTVIPFRTEDIKPEGSFKYHLQGVHWLDMFDKPLENALQDLYSQVSANLEAKKLIREKRIQKTREASGDQRQNPNLGDISSWPASAGNHLNSSLAEWKEALWWLARNGTIRSVDRAALSQLALKAGLDVDINAQISSMERNMDLFVQAISDVMSSGSIDTLSAMGLESIRVESCISAKEATAVMSELWQKSNSVSIEDGVEMPWIMSACDRDRSIACLKLPEPESVSESGTPDHIGTEGTEVVLEKNNAGKIQKIHLYSNAENKQSYAVTPELRPKKSIDEILDLDDSDIEALGIWHTSLLEDVSWDELILQQLRLFRRPSDTMQVFPYIKEARELRASTAHKIPFASAGRLLLKIDGLLVFDECLSVKQFWEKAKRYSFYDRISETMLQAEVDSLEKGFSLTLSRSSQESLGGKVGDRLAFDNLYGWAKADGDSLRASLPGLIKLLASKQKHKCESFRALNVIQELLSLHMKIMAGPCLNLLGNAELANQKKLASNAVDSICDGVVTPEELVMVIDKSILGNCKSGVVLSTKGVHRKEPLIAKYFIPWEEVEDVFLTDNNQLCVNNETLIEFQTSKGAGLPSSSGDKEDQASGWAHATACYVFACAEIFSGQELKDKDSLSDWTWTLADHAFDSDWTRLALALFKRSCKAQDPNGRDHDNIVYMIAMCLWKLDRFSECAALRMRLYENSVMQNGIDHSETFGAAYSLAEALSADDRRLDAIPLRRRELAWCRKEKGDTDPSTLTSINELAIDLRETGELIEAEALFRELVTGRQQALEPSDSCIGRALRGLAKTLVLAGKLEEALNYAQQALDHRLRFEGSDSWITNFARLDLTRVLHKLQGNAEALKVLDDLQASLSTKPDQDDDDRELLADAAELRREIEGQS